jgi:hypothetical protein
VAYWEIAYEKEWTKGTNRYSWTVWYNASPKQESQRDCRLFRKPVHISWPVWRKPWATGGDLVQVLLVYVDDTPLRKVRHCDTHILANSLKLWKACRLDGIPNESFRHLPRRPLVHLILFFLTLSLAVPLSKLLDGSKITLPTPGEDPKFPQNLSPISLLSTTGKLYEKVILKIVQRHIEEMGLLNANQFGFRGHHSTTLQCTRPTHHVTLNLNSNMSTAAVFLDTEKAFHTTWHLDLLYKLSTLQFSISLIKLTGSFLSQRKFRVSAEGEISTPSGIRRSQTQRLQEA